MALEEVGHNFINGYGVLELVSLSFGIALAGSVEVCGIGYAMIPDAGASEFLLLLFLCPFGFALAWIERRLVSS